MNVQGLGNKDKRKDTLNFLKGKNYSIYFLQDTHFTDKEMNYIRTQWGYECYFSNFASNARGVAILLNNNFEYKFISEEKDLSGNKLIVNLEIANIQISLINIYGPNRDDPLFYTHLKVDLQQYDNPCVVAGDFNLVLNPDIDCIDYINVNNPNARSTLLETLEECNLIDIWRDQNVETKQYTWFKKNSTKKARLDYFFISESLLTNVIDAQIKPGYRTDHSLITLSIDFYKFIKGKSYWKMNNSLLKDINYVHQIKRTIENVKRQYTNTELLRTRNFNEIPENELTFNINDRLFFEVLLTEIRGETISYATMKKRQESQKENSLYKEIENLERQEVQDHTELDEKRKELYNLREKKLQGSKIRSRAKWIQEGEKVTKYFCNLENRNFTSKSMTKLQQSNGNIINSQEEIIRETLLFYKKLYSQKENLQIDLKNHASLTETQKLTENQKIAIETPITYTEMKNNLKTMSNNKSPGLDGFTVEFYKFFWTDIGHFLVRSVNESFAEGELSISQKQGVITCLPKGNKDKTLLKNWRPISLLNVSYKITSACIAKRLKSVLPAIIDEDQTGFLPGRFIGENTRLLYDLLFYTEKQQIPGMLLLIDFEKAFDSVDWSFLLSVLDFFNFGPVIKRWVQVFYKNAESCVVVNGHMSEWFYLGRGCRQGDPLSPYLFLLCAEILAILIRNDKNIKGIEVGSKTFLVSQYADDTSLILDGSKASLVNTLKVLKFYASISGLVVNVEKTKVVWIGSKKNSLDKLCPEDNLDWVREFTVLGIKFSVTLQDMILLNYSDKIVQIKNLLLQWSKRNLTPIGKIAVIKSLALSKIVHLFQAIPNPNPQFLNEMQCLFFKFVWGNKPDKLRRKIMIQNYEDGGLKMVEVNNFIKSIKLTWIRRTIGSYKKYFIFLKELYPFTEKFLSFGSDYIDSNIQRIDNCFWKDAYIALSLFYKQVKPNSLKEFYQTPLWLNPNIKVGGNSVHLCHWHNKGILCINDLLNPNGSVMTLVDFQHKYNIHTNFIEFEGLLSSIRIYKQKLQLRGQEIPVQNPIILLPVQPIIQDQRGCRTIQDYYLADTMRPTSINKWEIDLDLQLNYKKMNIFGLPFKITKDSQLLWFQTKINNRILGTNSFLKKIKIRNTDNCSFCGNPPETITHLFIDCQYTKDFYHALYAKLTNCNSNIKTDWSKTDILFGNDKFDKVLNRIILYSKKFIYNQRCHSITPSINNFCTVLKKEYELEKYIAKIYLTPANFEREWEKYLGMVTQ